MTDENKGNFSEKVKEAVEIAEDAVHHPYIIKLSRLGFYTKGFLFIVIGILAILVAFGIKNGELTAANGALAAIAQIPFGKVILIIFIVGALGHGLWNILRGVADVDHAGGGVRGIGARIISAGVGIFYLILAWTAGNLIIKARSDLTSGGMQKTLTATLLELPLGAILVSLVGLGVVGAGFHETYSGITGNFQKNFRLREIKSGQRKIITILGILSFTARALIFFLMGYYFITAAIDYNPNEAIGMDGALLDLSQSYYGKTLLFVTAAGLVCHGVLAFYEAKYRRIY